MKDEAVSEGAGEVTREGRKALEMMREVLRLSGMGCEVELTESEDRIRLDVFPASEEDASILVGRQGSTLSAYQFLMNRMVREGSHRGKPISVDVSGYGERRREGIEDLARVLGETAVNASVSIQLVGMNPGDRRSMHMALADLEDVRTHSEDEGIARRLVVSPA